MFRESDQENYSVFIIFGYFLSTKSLLTITFFVFLHLVQVNEYFFLFLLRNKNETMPGIICPMKFICKLQRAFLVDFPFFNIVDLKL